MDTLIAPKRVVCGAEGRAIGIENVAPMENA